MNYADLSEQSAEEARLTALCIDLLARIQKMLKAKGYTRTDARLQSAMYQWTFRNGQREIGITGWHGTGKKGTCRWFGDLKSIHTIFDNQPGGVGPRQLYAKQVDSLDFNILDGTVEQYEAHLKAVEQYVRAL